MSLSGRYSVGEVTPAIVAELIPSKDFLGKEVKMFPYKKPQHAGKDLLTSVIIQTGVKILR